MSKRLGLLLLLLAATTLAGASSYRIELVIFERSDDSGGEIWRAAEGGPDMTRATDDLSNRTSSGGWLGPAAYTLNRNGHRILKHLAWIQDVGGRASNRWFQVNAPGLQGLIRVTKGRYLHLDIDLLVKGEFRAIAKRRMRSAQVHYIDHPRVGLLVRIDPYTPEAKPTER
jgi:hypothetical protein